MQSSSRRNGEPTKGSFHIQWLPLVLRGPRSAARLLSRMPKQPREQAPARSEDGEPLRERVHIYVCTRCERNCMLIECASEYGIRGGSVSFRRVHPLSHGVIPALVIAPAPLTSPASGQGPRAIRPCIARSLLTAKTTAAFHGAIPSANFSRSSTSTSVGFPPFIFSCARAVAFAGGSLKWLQFSEKPFLRVFCMCKLRCRACSLSGPFIRAQKLSSSTIWS